MYRDKGRLKKGFAQAPHSFSGLSIETPLQSQRRNGIKSVTKTEVVSQLDFSTHAQIKLAIASVDDESAHPRRPRCKYFGEMIQMDASSFEWIPGHIWHLHLAVDDSTGTVVGAYFDTQETLNGYYHVFFQILTNYGIPALFYTDRRTVS